MTTTLASMLERVREVLGDEAALGSSQALYSEGALAAGVRLALAQYALATGQTATLQGLDGAAETTLPGGHESLLARGAAGYAACARRAGMLAAALPEGFGAGSDLLGWAGTVLAEYYAGLKAIAEKDRLAGLATSSAPWGAAWEDAYDGPWGAWEG